MAALLAGFGLQVVKHPYEITVINPHKPERGTIHIATDDGYVCWEQPCWHFWGALEGCRDPVSDEATVTAGKIIQALTEPVAPFSATPPGT